MKSCRNHQLTSRLPIVVRVSTLFVVAVITVAKMSAAENPQETTSADRVVFAASQGLTITAGDWQRERETDPGLMNPDFGSPDETEALVRQKMTILLTRRLFMQRVNESGIGGTEAARLQIANAQRANIAGWVENVLLADQVQVSEDELAAAFERDRGKYAGPDLVEFQQIFLELKGLDPDSARAKRRLARQLTTELQNQPDRFDELARQYSDTALEPKHDMIRANPKTLTLAIRNPLLALEAGMVSAPVEAAYGLHILKHGGFTSGKPTLDRVRGSLERILSREKVQESILQLKAQSESRFGLIFPSLPDDPGYETLIIDGRRQFSLRQLILSHGREPEYLSPTEIPGIEIRDTRRHFVLEAYATENGLDHEPHYQRLLDRAREDVLVSLYTDWHIRQRGGITADTALKYYHSHLEDYRHDAVHRVRIMQLKPSIMKQPGKHILNRDLLEKARSYHRACSGGADLEALIRSEPMCLAAEEGGIVRNLYPSDGYMPINPGVVENLEIGEVSRPIPLSDGYALVQLLETRKDVLKPFSNVESSIKARLWRQAEDEWKSGLEDAIRADIQWSIPQSLIWPTQAGED